MSAEYDVSIKTRLSKFFLDFNKIFSNEKGAKELSKTLGYKIMAYSSRFDLVVGHYLIRTDSDPYHAQYPLVETVSGILDKPFARLYEYDDGQNPFLQGQLVGKKAVVVDGAAKTGNTLIRTARFLRARGMQVDDAFVVMLRPEGKRLNDLKSKFEREGLSIRYVFKAKDVLKGLYKAGKVSDEDYQVAMQDEDFA